MEQKVTIQFGWDIKDGKYVIGCKLEVGKEFRSTFWFPEALLDNPDLLAKYLNKKYRTSVGEQIIKSAFNEIP